MKKLSQEKLKKIVYYNPVTGCFRWKISTGKSKNNKIAGSIYGNGYRYICYKGKRYKASRLAFLYMKGYFPENEVDHKDRNKINDKWDNLREISSQCNHRNMGMLKNNTSGVKGVWFWKNRKQWISEIKINRKKEILGRFKNKTDAVKARWEAEKKYNWTDCCVISSAHQYLIKNKIIVYLRRVK